MQLFGTAEQAKLFCPGTKVPSLSRDKGTAGQAQKLATGRDGRDFLRLSHPVPGRPAGQNHHLFGTIMPFSELKKKNQKNILWSFCPAGHPGTENLVLGFLLLLLSRDKGTAGQGNFFVPGQRDNGTSRPLETLDLSYNFVP